MKHTGNHTHSADIIFSVVLFSLFLLSLLMLMLFSGQAYRTSVKGSKLNNNLYTASDYVTAKFHMHDMGDDIYTDTINGTQALCMKDRIDDKTYITYIYLLDGNLKELFTLQDNVPSLNMGTDIASLKSFAIDETAEGLYRISFEDPDKHSCSILLHPGSPRIQ
ncbi:MAG: DUF4860 domain-containing protein [Blautia sp.]|nr:DUF4860 domain-containing protein [Blautia sp.]